MAENARLIGVNHVALEVGDVEEAVALYGRLFDFTLRGRGRRMAFVDMGDQFLALSEPRTQSPDVARHVGIVVADKDAVRRNAVAAGLEVSPAPGLDIRDPWGNVLQIVDYRDVQFTKSETVLAGMGLAGLRKSPAALEELRAKGLV